MEKVLPKGWLETDIKTISEIIRGVSYKKEQAFSDNFDDAVYILRGGNIQDNKIDFDTDDNVYVGNHLINTFQLLKENDVVIVGSTGSKKLIGKAGIATHDLKNVSFGAFLMLLRTQHINKKYHSYFFQTKYYRNSISELAGGVNINNIRKEYLENLIFPLPPLAEQERIVAKLDKLFAQHEKIKAALDRIPQLLKSFRQQVLERNFTYKGYVPNSISLESNLKKEENKGWKWYKLLKIAKLESGHTPRKSNEEYWINGDVNWISLQDIRAADGQVIDETKFKPNLNGIKNSSARLLPKGTVCFCRDISVGFVTIMGREMATSQHFANWICSEKLNNKFLMYSLISARQYLIRSGVGTTVGTIYMPALKEMQIFIPPLQEQQEIVSRVESLFAKADAVEARYQTLKAKIESLPQAILYKAFKGELVPQLPTDGDAKDLLAEIIKLKEEAKPKKAKKK